jgi:hypothetical protein
VSARPPLVAVMSRVPLVSEGVAAALEEIAEVRVFPPNGDTPGLLRALHPDAVVVDDAVEAEEATKFAKQAGAPLLHISLTDRRLRIYGRDGWSEGNADEGASEVAIRNAIAGALYGRERR